MTRNNNIDEPTLPNTCCHEIGGIAAAYYNGAFDIVRKLNSKESSSTSHQDDGSNSHSNELKRIKSRREAARMQYQQLLFRRRSPSSSPPQKRDNSAPPEVVADFESKTDAFDATNENRSSTTTVTTDAAKSQSIPEDEFQLNPTSLSSEVGNLSPPTHDAIVEKTNDSSISSKVQIAQNKIIEDKEKSPFETIIGVNIENDDEAHESITSDIDIVHTLTTSTLEDSIGKIKDVPSFAQEHSIFVQALLQLLTERDKISKNFSSLPCEDCDILKAGPLKKISRSRLGMWKNKFVELRHGLLSYYEYVGEHDYYNHVKSIPLREISCKCSVIEQSLFSIGGAYVFELSVEGAPKRFWMANSVVERNEWVRCINGAIINSQNKKKNELLAKNEKGSNFEIKLKHEIPIPLPTQGDDRHICLQVRRRCQKVSSKAGYIDALSELDGKTLNVPVNWIKEKMAAASSNDSETAFKEETLEVNMQQLWKDMLRDTVSINGKVFNGDLLHGPEKIVGCLTRLILDFDRFSTKKEAKEVGASSNHSNRYCIKESEAVYYARDLLLSSNRTKSGGHSYYCISTLFSNPDLVVLVPSSSEAEPLKLTLRHIAPTKESANEESLLSEQLNREIVPNSSVKEKNKSRRRSLSLPVVFPILKGFTISHNTKDMTERTSLYMDSKNTHVDVTNSNIGGRATVEALVHVTSEYKICTKDPTGNIYDDTWGLVKVLFLQNFYVGGGPNGCLRMGGEAKIQFCVSCA